MQQIEVIAGLITAKTLALIVLALASGFDVDRVQAIGQALPVILAAGGIVALTTSMTRRELA